MTGKSTLCLDVITHIAEHLSLGNDLLSFTIAQDPLLARERIRRQQTLARLAQVSRAVSSLALDVLWEHVDDFRCLLSVFPSCENHSRQKGFCASISEADWARFQTYAFRVRSLYLGCKHSVHASVWVILARLTGRSPLLPNLERLAGFVMDEFSICQLILLSPTIRELELVIGQSTHAGVVRMLMDCVKSTLLTLNSLTVDRDFRRSSFDRVPLEQLWNFTQLQTLRISQEVFLAVDELEVLATFHNLQSLQLNLERMDYIPPGSIGGFPQLRDLDLSGETRDILGFMTSIDLPALESVTLSSSFLCAGYPALGTQRESTMRTLLAFLPSAVQRLCLSVTCSGGPEDGHATRLNEMIEELRPLTGLHSLRLTLAPRIWSPDVLSSDVLQSLRAAWPELRVFKVGAVQDSIQNSAPLEGRQRHRSPSLGRPARRLGLKSLTLSSVAAFASGHPHLKILELPSLDLGAIPDLNLVPMLGHTLREIHVDELVLYAPAVECALVLDRLFPHLDLRKTRNAVGVSKDDLQGLTLLRGILLGLQAGRGGSHLAHAAMLGGHDADMSVSMRGRTHREHFSQPYGTQPGWLERSPSRSPRPSRYRIRSRSPPMSELEEYPRHRHHRRARSYSPASDYDTSLGTRGRRDSGRANVFSRSGVSRVVGTVFEFFGLTCFRNT
ncbi:hypothetical protein FKP32DRAFT_1591148 [Trametes sanguinea]|nr:hypothetical protein FKP32DRAFT_1591148 [Trametes sanguinea]